MTAETPSFEPENALEEALSAALLDPEARPAFYAALYAAELLLPAPGPAPVEERLLSAPAGSEIDLPVVRAGERSVVPAFSSTTQLLRYVPEGAGYFGIATADLVKLWHDDLWLALNPRGPGTLLSPADVKALPGRDEYVLGEPRREPEELLQAIRAYGERSGRVVAAYRALMHVKEPGARPRVVIGLELAEGADRDEVFAQVTEAGRESGIDGFALVPVSAQAPGPVARYLREQTTPFYRRGA